jgi:3-deoxy-D-manno-octulosonic-acid transferase
MIYFLYSLIIAVGAILVSPIILLRNLQTPKDLRNLAQRFGALPSEVIPKNSGCIWVHAVSVGEALAALPLARKLKEAYPERPLLISTVTVTGQKLTRERFDFADGIFYFPFDWAWVVRRALRALRPSCVVVVETEIWPNFVRESRRAGVNIVFANGRISERSFHRHLLALKYLGFALRGFYKSVLANASLFLMQSEGDAERVRAMGAPPDRILVTGNMKYDSQAPVEKPLESWLAGAVARQGRRPLIVAGSVTSGEEPLVLIAFGVLQGQLPNALLVLAPRKPDRFDAAARHIEESQRAFVRRSQIKLDDAVKPVDDIFPPRVSVFLLDSIGELAGLYRLADAVFVGGSLVPAGGHNILEPAGFAKPPLFGPSMENFQAVAGMFLDRGAARQVESPEDLGVAWIELVQDKERGSRMGEIARTLVEENRGATDRTFEQIAKIVPRNETIVALASPAHVATKAQGNA